MWRHSDFLKFWSAQSLSLLGIQFGRIALPLAILALHASAAQVGVLAAIGGAPWLIFGLFAGIVIDRLPRRPILILAHTGRGILVSSVPVCATLGRRSSSPRRQPRVSRSVDPSALPRKW
nr:MFS transporter [Actinopolymorpha pittospori]